MKGSELRLPYAAYHFSTSGAAVAVATAVTHPLGTQFPVCVCVCVYHFPSFPMYFFSSSCIVVVNWIVVGVFGALAS